MSLCQFYKAVAFKIIYKAAKLSTLNLNFIIL